MMILLMISESNSQKRNFDVTVVSVNSMASEIFGLMRAQSLLVCISFCRDFFHNEQNENRESGMDGDGRLEEASVRVSMLNSLPLQRFRFFENVAKLNVETLRKTSLHF